MTFVPALMMTLLLGAQPASVPENKPLVLPQTLTVCRSLETAEMMRQAGGLDFLSPHLQGIVCFKLALDVPVILLETTENFLRFAPRRQRYAAGVGELWVLKSDRMTRLTRH